MDLAITNTWVCPVADGEPGVIEDGAVGVRDGEIAYVGPTANLDTSGVDRLIDGSGCATIPGLVDAHVHTSYALLRGAAQDLPEIEWIRRGLDPIASHMTDEDRVAGTRLGVIEGIRSGVTTFGEYAPDVGRLVDEVYHPFGVRVAATELLNEVVESHDPTDPNEPYPLDQSKGESGLERIERTFDRYADDSLVTPMHGPQALDMVSTSLLETVRERAAGRDSSIHVHVAQGRRERLQIEARYGRGVSTVDVLEDLGILSDRLIAVHCHGTTNDERARLAAAGVRMVGCPSSIAAIDGVVPPIVEFAERGVAVGLGTDQAPGPGGHNLLRELRTAALLSKVARGDPTTLPSWEVLRLGTCGGAAALGLADRIGSIAVGMRADLAVIDVTRAGLAPVVSTPFRTLVPNLVYASTGCEVQTVVIDGKPVLLDGEFVDIDEQRIVSDALSRAERVFADAADDWRAAGSALVRHVDAGKL